MSTRRPDDATAEQGTTAPAAGVVPAAGAAPAAGGGLPAIDLRQLLALTDDTGMFQHARWATPDPHHGYCIDDNARALIAAVLHASVHSAGEEASAVPLQRYLSFLVYAFDEATGRFRNFMGYDRRWLEPVGSQDSQGRTIWALGQAVQLAPEENTRGLALNLLHRALPAVESFAFLRSRAFALLGIDAYLSSEPDANAAALRDRLAEGLLAAWRGNADAAWPWFEDVATYDNAKLSHALLVAGASMERAEMIDAALTSLRWLLEVQTAEAGHLSIIGNDGWYPRGGERAQFDQQPLEAHALVHACLAAAELTGESAWADQAWRCFAWFRGANDLGVPLYDEQTGGCQDGLSATGPNANQGAESTLAYLLSVLELHRHHERQAPAEPRPALSLAGTGDARAALMLW